MAVIRYLTSMIFALGLALSPAPTGAFIQADDTASSAQTGAAPASSALDNDVSTMMQMMRDEGIDIDARMEVVLQKCRERFTSPDDGQVAPNSEAAIENCAVVDKQIVYAQAINEMNANRRAKFDSAMAQHLADVAEADRLQREYEREISDRATQLASQDTQTAPAGAPPTNSPPATSPPANATPAINTALAENTPTQTGPTPGEAAQDVALARNTSSSPATTPVEEESPAVTMQARGGSDSEMTMPMDQNVEMAVMNADGPRVALIIGNEDYFGSLGALANPVNDAVLIGATLRRLGFDVEILTDGSQREMREAVRRFGDRLLAAGENATGLFYYAGHGVQSQGVNYLIPVASEIDSESDLELEALAADAILAQMEESYVSTRIVILDACRNMPLRRRTRDGSRGLARMDTPNGSFLAYSTSPGNTAADGRGIHSPFAEALAEQMLVPDLPIEVTFREVRRKVVEVTNGNQVPWDSSSLLETFSFASSN